MLMLILIALRRSPNGFSESDYRLGPATG